MWDDPKWNIGSNYLERMEYLIKTHLLMHIIYKIRLEYTLYIEEFVLSLISCLIYTQVNILEYRKHMGTFTYVSHSKIIYFIIKILICFIYIERLIFILLTNLFVKATSLI